MSGQLDSAKYIIDKILAAATESHQPEAKFHLYETLARISEKKGDYKTSSYKLMLALNEAQENNIRLTQVGNISSQIKIDETESSYLPKRQKFINGNVLANIYGNDSCTNYCSHCIDIPQR
jgi:hypothetical protein